MYTLIEARALLRAASDLVALTSDNLRRILQIVNDHFATGGRVSGKRLERLAGFARLVLEHYWDNVFEWRQWLRAKYDEALDRARSIERLFGSRDELLKFIDTTIDNDVINNVLRRRQARGGLPPTISEQQIVNSQESRIPPCVLLSLQDDRRKLIENSDQVMDFIEGAKELENVNLYEWTSSLRALLCSL